MNSFQSVEYSGKTIRQVNFGLKDLRFAITNEEYDPFIYFCVSAHTISINSKRDAIAMVQIENARAEISQSLTEMTKVCFVLFSLL